MSEERNDAGQFTPSTDGLYGRAAELAEAGFTKMPEPKPPEQEDLTPREAGEALAASRDSVPVTPIQYQDGTGAKVDANESVSLERAAADLSAYRASQVDSAAKSISSDFASAIDSLRGEAIEAGLDPKETGIDKVPKTADVPAGIAANESGDEPAEPGMEHLDPETRKALKIPQVREALEQQFAQADEARQQYTGSLQAGQQMMQATVAALAPQLQGMPLELWPQAIQALSQVDPVRGQLVADTLNNWNDLQQAQQQVRQQQAYHQHQQFEATVKAEDARLIEMFGGDKATATAANNAVISYLSERGVPRQQMMQMVKSNPVLQTAEARQTIWEAEQYRAMKNAPKAVAKRDIPPVQRPGTAGPRISSDASALSGLEAKFSRSGSAKDAAAALVARRKARG